MNQNFNPVAQDQIWAGDIAYVNTSEVGVPGDNEPVFIHWLGGNKRKIAGLIGCVMTMICSLRQPPRRGWYFT
ncbi:MAG: hypothetical protein QS748_04970 [Candidatus Endonucleobacter bathymodioli]|uniref:Uncharacterized protein n=1 Tax=Candidatus Endonucleibacter bathymodioli TaxID=539814 RepID=A0AA90NXK5_9GAMM|nr:hypothetical protein [Candidatus Endonucleobacter bathymodioli]